MGEYDWSGFYSALMREGPKVLRGFTRMADELSRRGLFRDTEEIISYIAEQTRVTEFGYSDSIEASLAACTQDGDLREGVLQALEVWRENVVDYFCDRYGLLWEDIGDDVEIDSESPIIDLLVEASRAE